MQKGVICSVGMLLVIAGVAHAATYYVATSGLDTRSGLGNWTNALATISNAVAKAANGDSILVSNGAYYLSAQISVAKALDIRGFSGDPKDTIVNGNYPAKTNRCFSVAHTSAVISALTITNGCVAAAGAGGGGGVQLTSGVISNCVVSGNRSFTPYQWGVEGGGGLNIAIHANSSGALVDSVISGNICTMHGGGVQFYITAGPFLMKNCTVSANTATTNYAGLYGSGGGMAGGPSGSGYLLITNCAFVSNVSYQSGGGINYSSASLINNGLITHTIIRGNTVAASSGWYGGGVYFSMGTLRNCLIANNTTTAGRGGGVYCAGATTRDKMLQSCTIVSNVCGAYGGGGVAIIASANPYLQNCIIWDNSSGTAGWSNVSVDASSTQVSFTNCCTAGGGYVPGALTNNYSANNITLNPLLTAAYQLPASSPCVNSGSNQNWMVGATDLEGNPRKDVLSGLVDMGAYEYTPPMNTVPGESGGHVTYTYQIGLSEVKVSEYVQYLNAADVAGTITVSTGQVLKAGSSTPYCLTQAADTNAPVIYTSGLSAGQRFSAVAGRTKHPLVFVSWFGAAAFCNWKSDQEGLVKVYNSEGGWSAQPTNSGYRLPMEAEWRKAAAWNADTLSFYAYGTGKNTMTNTDANYLFSGDSYETNAVATCPVNAYGCSSPYLLQDASGNVWEWCQDFYEHTGYDEDVDARAVRGGSWGNLSTDVRSVSRSGLKPGYCEHTVGFRLARQAGQ